MTASGKIQKYKLRDYAKEQLGLADVKVFASDAEGTEELEEAAELADESAGRCRAIRGRSSTASGPLPEEERAAGFTVAVDRLRPPYPITNHATDTLCVAFLLSTIWNDVEDVRCT